MLIVDDRIAVQPDDSMKKIACDFCRYLPLLTRMSFDFRCKLELFML